MIFALSLLIQSALALDTPPAVSLDVAGTDISTLRDPFRRPVILGTDAKPLSELESFPTEDYKMVGVLTGPDRVRAMIVAPNGKTHFVAEKTKIGVRKGMVTRITPNSVHVRERVLNTLGKEEVIQTELRLPGT